MRQAGLFLSISLLITCTFGPSGPAASQSNVMTNDSVRRAQVTLDIFSGRENPSWELSTEQLAALVSILDTLPGSDPKNSFDGLGYRGFLVVISDAASGKTERIKAYKGAVVYSVGGVDKLFDDKERRMENLLLDSGRDHLKADIRDAVSLEIEPPRP